MPRLDTERQNRLEPKRMDSCKAKLEEMGYTVTIHGTTCLTFMYNGEQVKLFPYSGWHTGKSIKDGRGFKKLINQL